MKFPITLSLFNILLAIQSLSAQDNAESTLNIDLLDPFVALGSSVTLLCYVDDALASVRWVRGGNRPLPPNAQDEYGFLTISNAQPENAGIYTCEIISDSSSTSAQSVDVTLVVGGPSIDSSSVSTASHARDNVEVTNSPSQLDQSTVPVLVEKPRIHSSSVSTAPPASTKVELIIDPAYPLVPLHSKVILNCHAKDNSPVTVHWLRINRNVPFPTRVKDENGKLTISDVQSEDAGFYICETTGGSPSALVQRARVMLLVEGPRDDSARRVPQQVNEGELTIYPVYPSVKLHSTITLSCYAKDHSPVSVQWRRREKNIPFPSHAVVKNGDLTISNAQLEDGGFYVCETTDDSPSKLKKRADVTLYVERSR